MVVVFTGSPSYTSSSSTQCRDKTKEKAGAHISNNSAPQGSVCYEWECDSFFFPWVEKFSSLALTIPIVVAASAHMYSIHNWTVCNKFSRAHQVEFWAIWGIIARGRVKMSPTPLIIHCTVGKNRIFIFLIGFWQPLASQQGHWFDSQGLRVQRSPCVRLHGCSSSTPPPDYEWLFVSVWMN